jgi:hypothetical protein
MAPSVPCTKQSTRLLLWLVQLGGSVVIAPPKFSQADQLACAVKVHKANDAATTIAESPEGILLDAKMNPPIIAILQSY